MQLQKPFPGEKHLAEIIVDENPHIAPYSSMQSEYQKNSLSQDKRLSTLGGHLHKSVTA